MQVYGALYVPPDNLPLLPPWVLSEHYERPRTLILKIILFSVELWP